MNIACYILPAVLGLLPSHGRRDFVGTWVLDSSPDAVSILRQAGLAEQEIRVRFFSDETFEYTTRSNGRSHTTRGRYEIDGDRVTLDADDEFTELHTASIDGRLTDDGLDLDGAGYHRLREQIRREMPQMTTPNPPVESPLPLPTPPIVETPAPVRPTRPLYIDMAGLWDLVRNGIEDKSVKFRFTKAGRFEFQSANAASKGRYNVAEGVLTLNYEEVDGAPVTFPMRKTIDLDDEGSFTIDRFTYVRVR